VTLYRWSRELLEVVLWTDVDVSLSEEFRLTWMKVGDKTLVLFDAPLPVDDDRKLSFRKNDLPSIYEK